MHVIRLITVVSLYVALAVVYCSADKYNEKPLRLRGKLRKDQDYYVRPGVTAAQLLRARGYLAHEYRFKTKDGYVLTIIRGTNPLINGGKHGLKHKDPILFVHGAISSAPIWLLNSKGARPQDFTKINVKELSVEKLNEMIGHYDSARSMPTLAMNFGYEVWLVNRRGFSQSEDRAGHLNRTWPDLIKSIPATFLGELAPLTLNSIGDWMKKANKTELENNVRQVEKSHNLEERKEFVQDFWLRLLAQVKPIIDLPGALSNFGELKRRIMHTFDSDYWSFSFDEQAEYDFPQTIEFVLKKTGHKRLNVITHSAAASVTLMSLSIYPHLAHKIRKLINWSSCVNTGTNSDIFGMLSKLNPFIKSYTGPIPFAFMNIQVSNFMQNICNTDLKQRTICEWLLDAFFGQGNGQQPPTQFILSNILQPTSSREIQHILQMANTERPHRFKYNTREQNMKKYGQPDPPAYDFGRIKLRNMVFHVGADDTISSHGMVKATASQLSVPSKIIIVNETGVHYNHAGAFLHDQTVRLTNLPSLIEIERAQAKHELHG